VEKTPLGEPRGRNARRSQTRCSIPCMPVVGKAVNQNEMHPEDLMKPDLFSEIVLMGSGGLLFASLILIVVIAFTRV